MHRRGSVKDFEIKMQKPVVVDLFCGAGGLAYGMKSAGLEIAAGVDMDPSCKFPIEANSDAVFSCRDVADVTPSDLEDWFDGAEIRVLAGCAPCQPFSTYSQSRKSPDNRWNLLTEFQRLAIATRPEIVTMENVVGLSTQAVWIDFVASLEGAGYSVSWRIVDCDKFGIPQSRRRLVLIGSLKGPIKLEDPEDYSIVTVRDAISDLPAITPGQCSVGDSMHVSSTLSAVNIRRIVASKPGGTWRDWPIELRAKCHTKLSGKTYPSVYGRMEWEKPAPTMTTQCYGYGNGRFGHPDQNRAISLREAAILQSFPRDYKFVAEDKDVTFNRLGTLIGNAVPPKLGEAIGRCILSHLADEVVSEVEGGAQLKLV
jgi:DNA (cytosine-5)-methyltransferase 1